MKMLRRLVPPSAVLMTMLSIVAASSLVSVLRGPGLFGASVSGAILVLAVTVVATRFELLTMEWLALSLFAFLVFGAFVTGPVPSPSAYGEFFAGLTTGWADLLSSIPPVAAESEMAVLPYTLAWLASMLGFGIMRHVKIAIAGAAGPVIIFGIGLLFSIELQGIALIQGSVIVALSLALGWYQQRRLGFEVDEEIGNTTVARRRARLLYAGAALAVAAGAAPLVAPLAPGLDGRERFDLRDQLEPPWNPLDEPSPLAQIKGNYLDDVRDDVVFIARGESIPRRWGLATLASFDGTVWTVGDAEIDGLAPFVPIDLNTPAEEIVPEFQREPADVDVEIVDLDGPWLPLPGRPDRISIVGDRSSGSLRFNDRTGTAAMPAGVQGVEYTVVARPWPLLRDEQLAELTYAYGGEIGVKNQAAAVRNWSADVVEGADAGWEQIDAIRDSLTGGGYLADERVRPGHSWARLNEFFESDPPYGNEEQYGAVAGIAARNAGLRSRVVVGYLFDSTKAGSTEVAVTKTEATAWLEVFTDEYGWIPIDVTPDRDNEPTIEDSGVRIEAVAAPNPPPTIPPPPEQEVAPDEELAEDEDEEVEEEATSGGLPTFVIAGLLAIGGPVVVVGGWIGLIVLLKTMRRRRRRSAAQPSARIAGAWFEARDRLSEFGIDSGPNASLHEFAAAAEAHSNATVGVKELADLTDQSAFAPIGTTDLLIDAAWDRSDAIVSRVRRSRTTLERFRVLISARSLFRRDPV